MPKWKDVLACCLLCVEQGDFTTVQRLLALQGPATKGNLNSVRELPQLWEHSYLSHSATNWSGPWQHFSPCTSQHAPKSEHGLGVDAGHEISKEVWVALGWLGGVTLTKMLFAVPCQQCLEGTLCSPDFTDVTWEQEIQFACTCDIPPLRGRSHARFVDAHGQKEQQQSEGLQKLTSLNYTLALEIGRLVPDLLYKHTSAGAG